MPLVDGRNCAVLIGGLCGRLLTDQTWSAMGLPTATVHHDHDNAFRIEAETVNGAFPASFVYDNDGLLTSAGAMTLDRNAQTGLLDGSTFGPVVDTYTRNAHGEVTHYEVKVNGAVVFAVDTPRDALGRIDTRTETIDQQTMSIDYVYDPAGRLEEVTDLGTNQILAHYDYDPNGNRLGRTHLNGTEVGMYDAQDRLEEYAGRIYEYTPAGSLSKVTDGNAETTYAYDALGGLRHVGLPNGDAIAYIVDGAGRRIWKTRSDGFVQGFVYSDGLRPIAELDGNGNVVARFVYGRHRNVPDLLIKNGTTYRIVTDHLGSPRLVVNAQTGAIAQRMDYDEFGRVVSDSAPGFQPFGFAGGIYDTDTKLVRFGARDYDAFTGRWTAKDPILWAGGQANLYGYVGNDPVNWRDPSGLLPWAMLSPIPGTVILDPANVAGFWATVANFFVSGSKTSVVWNGGNPIVLLENTWLPFGNRGLTLGHVVILRGDRDTMPGTYSHELAHVSQHDLLGPTYLMAHIYAQAISHITTGEYDDGNPLEWGPRKANACPFGLPD